VTLRAPAGRRKTNVARGARADSGLRMVSVARLRQVCDPFDAPPWEAVTALSIEGVQAAMLDGFELSDAYSDGSRSRAWCVDDHIARIAYLAAKGWDDAIEVDVGIPHMNCWVDWPVTDGNHRLAAAIARGDKFIVASVGGCCDYMRELLGPLRRCLPPGSTTRR